MSGEQKHVGGVLYCWISVVSRQTPVQRHRVSASAPTAPSCSLPLPTVRHLARLYVIHVFT